MFAKKRALAIYIYSFLLYLHQLMLVNVKLQIKGYIKIVLQGYIQN